MLQFMLEVDLFICNQFIYLRISLLLSVLPMLTEKWQPVFDLSLTEYFVCCICPRLARQKATWKVRAFAVPQVLKGSTTKGPCVCGSRCFWMGWFFLGLAVAACAFGIVFATGTVNLALQGFSNVPSSYALFFHRGHCSCPLAFSLFRLFFGNRWCLVLVLFWLFLRD